MNKEILDKARDWLEKYEYCVRHKDYQGAKSLFFPCGTYYGMYVSMGAYQDQITEKEWKREWPCIQNFCWSYSDRIVVESKDKTQYTVFLPFTSTGYTVYGNSFDRNGRATILLINNSDSLVCMHMHISVNPGVQHESFLCS